MESVRPFASEDDSDGFPQELSGIMGKSDLELPLAHRISPRARGNAVEEGSLRMIAELARKVSDFYLSITL